MTATSSEYGFPIFISSTEYNLIDLRAELAVYLSKLGYRPILSSSDGFHDNSPELEPWESCLQVLQSAFIMILVIDGRYGAKLDWKNFESIFESRRVSPTHGEYIFAHKSKMRMLVFIRRELMTHYQSYRRVIKNSGGDKEKAKESLIAILPKQVDFETLEFIEEVKTTRPIPWIKPFDNVTDIKQEIQKKMLNELAELFLFRNKHLEAVVMAFASVLDDLPEEKRKDTLKKIGTTRDLIEEIEGQTKVISELKKEKESLALQLSEKEGELEEAEREKKEESNELKRKVKELSKELDSIDTKISTHELNNAKNLFGGPISGLEVTSGSGKGINAGWSDSHNSLLGTTSSVSFTDVCEKCGKVIRSNTSLVFSEKTKTCMTCRRKLCKECFTGGDSLGFFNLECKDCRDKKFVGGLGIK